MSDSKKSKDSPNSGKKFMRKQQEETEKQTKSGFPQRTNPSNINNSKMGSSPKSSQKGKAPNEQQNSKKIEAQKDYSSGSSNSFESLGQYIDHYVCGCTKCHPKGIKDLTTDYCYKELVTRLKSLVFSINDRTIELDLLKKEIMTQPQPPSFQELSDRKVDFLREIISEMEGLLLRLVNQFQTQALGEAPIEPPNMTNEQQRCQVCENIVRDFASKLMQFIRLQRECDESQKEKKQNTEYIQVNAKREGEKKNDFSGQGDPTEYINIGIDSEETENKSADLQYHEKTDSVNQENIENVDIKQTQTDQRLGGILQKKAEEGLPKIQEQLKNSQKKIQHLEEEMKIATEQQGNYAAALTEKDKQIQAYKDQQYQLKRQLAEKQELISSMNQKDADKQKQISRLTAEKAELKNDLLKTKKNHASLEQKYTDLEAQKAGLAQEIRLNQIRVSELLVESQLLTDQLGQYKMKQTNSTQSLKLQFDSSKNDWQQKMETLRAEHTQKVTQIQHQKRQLSDQLKGKEQAITNLQAAMKGLQELYDKDKFDWSEQREKMVKQIESLESLNKKLEEDINTNNLSLEKVKGVLQEIKKQSEQKLTKEKLQHFKELQEYEQKHKQQTARLTQNKDKSIEEIQKTHQLKIKNLTDQFTQLQQEKLKIESQLTEHTNKISQLQIQKLQLQDQLKEKEEIIINRQAAVKDLQELSGKDKFEWSEEREKMVKNIESLEQFNKKLEKDINTKYQSHKEQVNGVLQQTKTEFESKLNEEKMTHCKELQAVDRKHKQQIARLTQSKDKQIQEIQQTHQLQIGNLKNQHMQQLTAESIANTELQEENQRVATQLAALSNSYLRSYTQQTDLLSQRTKIFDDFLGLNEQTRLADQQEQRQNYETLLSTVTAFRQQKEYLEKQLAKAVSYSTLFEVGNKVLLQDKQDLQNTIVSYQNEAKRLKEDHQKEIDRLNSEATNLDELWAQRCNSLSACQDTSYKAILESERSVLTAQIDTLKTQVQQLEEASQFKADISKVEDILNQKEIEDLKNTIRIDGEEHEKEVARLKAQVKRLQESVQNQQGEIDELRDQKLRLQLTVKEDEFLVERVNRTASQFLGAVGKQPLKELLQRAALGFDNHIDSLFRMTKSIAIFHEELNIRSQSLENQKNILETQVTALEKDILNTKAELEKMINSQKGDMSVLNTQFAETKTQLDGLHQKEQNLWSQLEQAKQKETLLLRQLSECREQNQKTQQRLSELQQFKVQSTQEKQLQILTLQEQNRKSLALMSDEKKKAEDSAKLLDQYLNQNVLTQQQNNTLKKKVKEYEKELIQLKKQNEEMEKKISQNRKSLSLKNNEPKKVEESQKMINKYINLSKQTQQQNDKLKNKLEETEKRADQLKKKIVEYENKIQEKRNSFENTISKQDHRSQIQEFEMVIEQQKLQIKKVQEYKMVIEEQKQQIQKIKRGAQSMITESAFQKRGEELQERNQQLERENSSLQDRIRELQNNFPKESPLARQKSEKGFIPIQQGEQSFVSLFSSRTLLDLTKYQKHKEFLVKMIQEVTKRSLKESSLAYTYSLKNRIFNTIANKTMLTNDENYIFLFHTRTKEGLPNLFAFVIFKTGQKLNPILGFLFLLSKETICEKKKDASSTVQPISFDYTGSQITFGGTYKIKSGDTKIKADPQSKYFDLQNPLLAFDKQSKEVELQNMEIHKLILE